MELNKLRIAYIFPLSPILPWILEHRTTTFIPSPLFSQNPVKWDKLCKSFYSNRNHESPNSLNNIPNDCLASTMRVNQHAKTMSSNVLKTGLDQPVQPVQPSIGHMSSPIHSIEPFNYWTGHEPSELAVRPVTRWNRTVQINLLILEGWKSSTGKNVFRCWALSYYDKAHTHLTILWAESWAHSPGASFGLLEDSFYRHPFHLYSSPNPMWDC